MSRGARASLRGPRSLASLHIFALALFYVWGCGSPGGVLRPKPLWISGCNASAAPAAPPPEIHSSQPNTPAPTTSGLTTTTAESVAAPAPPAPPPPLPRFEEPPVDPARLARISPAYGREIALADTLEAFRRDHPELVDLVVIGRTVLGRPIYAAAIGRAPRLRSERSSLLLTGATHGDEPLAAHAVIDAMDYLLGHKDDADVKAILDNTVVWALPLVNPDGFANFMQNFGAGRKNGRRNETAARSGGRLELVGVDLNRNFPFRWGSLKGKGGRSDPTHRYYKGPSAGSEPEVQAVVRLAESEHFAAAISFHVGTVALLAPYTIDEVPNPKPNEAWIVAEEVLRQMPRHPEKEMRVVKNLYPVDGTENDYYRGTFGTVAFLVESAARSWEGLAQRDQAVTTVRSAWRLLFARFVKGPSVTFRVRDGSGHPVIADVSVAELPTFAGERWMTRCRDGQIDRYLLKAGTYTVVVRRPGASDLKQAFEVKPTDTHVRVDIVVPGESADAPKCPTPWEDPAPAAAP